MEKLSEKIPIDVFLKTITYLPFKDVINICSANQKFHSYCNDTNYNNRWKNLIDNTFNHTYDYYNKLDRLWKELGYKKETYNYLIYTQLVKLLDPITQLMIYYKQKDMDSFDNPKFSDDERFLVMYLLNDKEGMKKYYPPGLYDMLLFDMFLKEQPSVNDLYVMLVTMARYGSPLGVKILLDRGVDINARNNALTIASQEGHTETVKLLLEQGANIHNHGDVALRVASKNGHTDTVKLLIDQGANVNAMNGLSLRWASGYGHIEVVKLLLDQGADIHAINDKALKLANQEGHSEIVKLLIDRGANIDVL